MLKLMEKIVTILRREFLFIYIYDLCSHLMTYVSPGLNFYIFNSLLKLASDYFSHLLKVLVDLLNDLD